MLKFSHEKRFCDALSLTCAPPQAILVENGSLRESLSVMQRELVSLLNEQQRAQQPKKPVSEEGEEFGGLSSGHFQMPYDIVRDGELPVLSVISLTGCGGCGLTGVERTFRDHLQTLREQLQTATQQQQQQQEGLSLLLTPMLVLRRPDQL